MVDDDDDLEKNENRRTDVISERYHSHAGNTDHNHSNTENSNNKHNCYDDNVDEIVNIDEVDNTAAGSTNDQTRKRKNLDNADC